VIAVRVQPQATDSSLLWVEAVAPADRYRLVRPGYDITNAGTAVWASSVHLMPTRTAVERGFEYAMTHYENLLRRLAD
jgi:hypothetical protein